MLVIPAIDIIDGKPVRLYQGDYATEEDVGSSVLELAKDFVRDGATYIHLVDLDGAKEGTLSNKALISKVIKKSPAKVEVGGGIRKLSDVEYYVNEGIDRIILGTAAINNEVFLKEALTQYGDKIAVGIDCKNRKVCIKGWLGKSEIDYIDMAKKMEDLGVKTVIVTDISKDGTLKGPNIPMLKELKENISINIIASGGISNIEDIKSLSDLGMYAAITGKALYKNKLNLKEALRVGGMK